MSIHGFLRDHRKLVIGVGVLSASSLDVIVLKLALLGELEHVPAGALVTSDKIREIVDELELPLSLREAGRIAIESGLLEPAPDGYRVPASCDSELWFDAGAAGMLGAVALEEIHAALAPAADDLSATDVGTIAAVLARNRDWALEIAGEAERRDLPGLPVFWECVGLLHEPRNAVPGSMATTDALHLCVERTHYGLGLGSVNDQQIRALAFLVGSVLGLQSHETGWDHGAFVLPTWDDDFVGTFDPTVDSVSPCPTTDATANAILGLCAFAESAELCEACDPQRSDELHARIVRALLDGIDCLFRWQLDTGGWAIYRYPSDTPAGWQLPARDMSSRYAIEALARAMAVSEVAEQIGDGVRAAAESYARFLTGGMEARDDGSVWGGKVDAATQDADTRLRATAILAPTVHMIRGLGVATPELDALELEVARYIEREWTPAADRYVLVRFRVPTRNGPGDHAEWELPTDPVIVCALLASDRLRGSLSHELAGRIQRAVAGFLQYERHGHWSDFLMAQEGEVVGMTGNTRHYHRALLEYLSWQAQLHRQLGLAGNSRAAGAP